MSKKKKKDGVSVPGRNRQMVVRSISGANNTTIIPEYLKDQKTSYFEIDVVMKSQKGVDYFSGELDLMQLAALTQVDTYDGDHADIPGKGQRALSESRGKQFMNFISDRDNVCFMEILLNERDGKVEFISLKQMGIDVPRHNKLSARHGILRIPKDTVLYVYDGQTRRYGYLSLLHFDLEMLGSEAYADFKHLKVPFCLCQVSPDEETKLFLQHNKQTSVANDHKAMVIWHSHKDLCHMKNSTYTEKTRSIVAGMTYIISRDRTNPWFKKIAMPDLSKEENKKRLGNQSSFNTGLKHFIGWLKRNYWSPETSYQEKSQDLADMCTIFWRSVQKNCPKIWRTPENYVQLKSPGISSLSMLMHTLYIDFFDRGIDWNISNISASLKKSKIITTPKKWEVGEEISKRGGNYKALQSIERDIYDQIRKG